MGVASPGALPLTVSEIRYFPSPNNNGGVCVGEGSISSSALLSHRALYDLCLQMNNVTISKEKFKFTLKFAFNCAKGKNRRFSFWLGLLWWAPCAIVSGP